MKHLTLGTAGHVDHGKTTLIKKLTGYDCDTHKDEQKRGITIHLGFTNIKIDDEHQIGIIDVPGHKDFVNTMIAGATAIDFVMLVIAADSGIMPQTIEHLKIMQLLGIKSGFVALTKVDLVDEELLELAVEEIEEFTEGSFLEGCKIINVSAKSGIGIPDIKAELLSQIERVQEKDLGIIFRMYIDRIFSVEGYGTVVNGSVLSGKLSKRDSLMLLPTRKEVRIRAIQKFNTEVDDIFPGDRASLNIVGLKVSEFKRGMVLSTVERDLSCMIDCTIENYSKRVLKQRTTVIFITGTFKSKGKIHLINCDSLKEGESGIAQLTLEKGGFFYFNDKFIIRDSSNELTFGGGKIIDVYPLKHKKRSPKLITKLENIVNNDLKAIILHEIEKSIDFISSPTLSTTLNVSVEQIEATTSELNDSVAIIHKGDSYLYILKANLQGISDSIYKVIRRHHLQNSLSLSGLTLSEIKKYIQHNQKSVSKTVLTTILDDMCHNDILKQHDSTYSLFEHEVASKERLFQIKDDILAHVNSFDVLVPENSSKADFQNKFSLKQQEINSIINYLLETQRITPHEDNFVSLDVINKIARMGKEEFGENPFKVAQFRDLLKANRKIALYYLEILDKLSITRRDTDTRTF